MKKVTLTETSLGQFLDDLVRWGGLSLAVAEMFDDVVSVLAREHEAQPGELRLALEEGEDGTVRIKVARQNRSRGVYEDGAIAAATEGEIELLPESEEHADPALGPRLSEVAYGAALDGSVTSCVVEGEP